MVSVEEEGVIWDPDEIDELCPESMDTTRNGDRCILTKEEIDSL